MLTQKHMNLPTSIKNYKGGSTQAWGRGNRGKCTCALLQHPPKKFLYWNWFHGVKASEYFGTWRQVTKAEHPQTNPCLVRVQKDSWGSEECPWLWWKTLWYFDVIHPVLWSLWVGFLLSVLLKVRQLVVGDKTVAKTSPMWGEGGRESPVWWWGLLNFLFLFICRHIYAGNKSSQKRM